jgi:hypothetical protein
MTLARPTPIRAIATFLAVVAAALSAQAGGLAIVRPVVSDNGDDDGYADTRETVSVRLEVQNTSGLPLQGVQTHLDSPDGPLVCITDPTILVGNLAPGEIRLTDEAFTFVVADVNRTALFEDLSLRLVVTATANGADPPVHPGTLVLDLDLDVSGGTGPTTYFESFEQDPHSFAAENLDADLDTTELADGHRCQYNDPDWINSHNYGLPEFNEPCHPGNSPLHADMVFWGLSGPETSPLGGRGFSGLHSLFFGLDLGPPDNWTTPVTTLEAASTIDPIHLGWDGVAPVLSFVHQVSLVDSRAANLDPGESYDRSVVMAQVADADGSSGGPWIKIEPHQNVYDQQNAPFIFNCAFDPIDDGTTEDDFFHPNDPDRLFGPSSTCWPEYTYVHIGETSNAFDAANVGRADGPGLDGVWGIGTWIESRFDLSRFRGRSVRVRYLFSAVQAGNAALTDWEKVFDLDDDPGDDGWWIDDVTIAGALETPAVVGVDEKDNNSLPGVPPGHDADGDAVCTVTDNCPDTPNGSQADGDMDGWGTACDCADADGGTHPGAIEENDGVDNQCAGDPGYGLVDEMDNSLGFHDPNSKTLLSWNPQFPAKQYRLARAWNGEFTDHCQLFPIQEGTSRNDPGVPQPGKLLYYLVRAIGQHVGSWGADSSGQERDLPCD